MQNRLHRGDSGQGLVELIVALTVLAIGIGALVTILTSSALALQRSGQKGTALTLAEKQLELYRNLSYPDIRLDAAAVTSADASYKNAYLSDPNIPPATNELTDLTAGTNPCSDAAPPPECSPVQYVGPGTGTPTPDNRKYRIDTYIVQFTPNGGDKVAKVFVIVRNAQISTYPILARSASTFSAINIANVNGKALVSMSFSIQRAAIQGSTADNNAITATLVGGTGETGDITFYVLSPGTTPSPPCPGSPPAWQQVGSPVTVSGDGSYHPSGTLTFSSTGTYYWYAAYSGDPLNKKASSICGATMPATVVRTSKWSPTLTLSGAANATVSKPMPGSAITATLSASSGYTPNAITLMAYYSPTSTPPSTCTTTPGSVGGGNIWYSAGSVSPNGDGSYSPSATGFTPTVTGRYWWYASYPLDSTNNGATSRCDGSTSIAHTDVTVAPDTFTVVAGVTQSAGSAFNVTINAIKPDGVTLDTGYAGSKTLVYTGPSTSPSGKAPVYQTPVTFTNGAATVPVTLYTAETKSLTVTDGQVTGTSAPITVSGGSTAGFTVTSDAFTQTVGTQTAGVSFTVTLTAVDQYGNPSAYTGTHKISWSGPANAPNGKQPDYPGSTDVPFTAGLGGPVTITLYNASVSTVLTATETATIKGSSQPFIVKGNTAQSMTFLNCSKPSSANTTCSGQPISISNKTMTANVGLLDAYLNPANTGTAVTVDLTSSDASGATVTTPVNIPAGSTQSTQLTVTGLNKTSTTTITAHASAGGSFPDAKLTITK